MTIKFTNFAERSHSFSDFECHISNLSALDQSERRIRRMARAERGPPHARGARRVTRASTCHECTPAAARRHSCRRVDAEPAKRRVSAFRRVGGKRNGGNSRGAMHGQVKKRRRRDARAATVTYTRTLTHQSLKRRVN